MTQRQSSMLMIAALIASTSLHHACTPVDSPKRKPAPSSEKLTKAEKKRARKAAQRIKLEQKS